MLTPGEIFRKRREALRKSIYSVSLDTKIQEKYIQMLEENRYKEFSDPVFANGFVKIYSEYLGLNQEKLLALYRREDKKYKPKGDFRKENNHTDFFNKYKNIIIQGLVVLTVLSILTMTYIYNMNNPAENEEGFLEVNGITNNQEIKEGKLTTNGKISPDHELYINNQKQEVNEDQTYNIDLDLEYGENILRFELKNQNGKILETRIFSITRKKPEKEEIVKQETSYKVYLEITEQPTWITLSIDNNQVIAQALNPGKTDSYNIKENLVIVSGKPNNTKVYINNKIYRLNINSVSGTATLRCTVSNNLLSCEE